MRIVCGFCGTPTELGAMCANCRHDPLVPYLQRGEEPEAVPEPEPGRPKVDAADVRGRLARATLELTARGVRVTQARLAEELGVDPATVRRWQNLSD